MHDMRLDSPTSHEESRRAGATLMAGCDDSFDIIVVGAGPVGLSFAASLASQPAQTGGCRRAVPGKTGKSGFRRSRDRAHPRLDWNPSRARRLGCYPRFGQVTASRRTRPQRIEPFCAVFQFPRRIRGTTGRSGPELPDPRCPVQDHPLAGPCPAAVRPLGRACNKQPVREQS